MFSLGSLWWSSGQFTFHLNRQLEFETLCGLQFSSAKILLEENGHFKKRSVLSVLNSLRY